MASTIDVLLPNSSKVTLVVTLLPGLTVLDLKKLIVTEMVALGHGGGGSDNIRLVHRGKELVDTTVVCDVGFEKIDTITMSHVLFPPEITSVIELQATRDFLHSPTRQRTPSESVGSLAMSRASTMEGGQKLSSRDDSSVQEAKSEAVSSTGGESHNVQGTDDKTDAVTSAYPPAPVFRSRLYEYSDFLYESYPSNGGHRVALDGAISIKFRVGKNGMIPSADAFTDMGPWRSKVESLPTKTNSRHTLSTQLERDAATIAEDAKRERDSEKRKKKFDPFSKEPPLADQNAKIEAEAVREAAQNVAKKCNNKAGAAGIGALYGDMEEYYDRNKEELAKRGYVRWTHHEYNEAVLLVKASDALDHKAKYSAREASIAKKYETVGSVSIAQSRRTGGLKSSNGGGGDERSDIDTKLDRIRYWWRGVNDGYCHGDRHSWQRYTQCLPLPCSMQVGKEGGLGVDIPKEMRRMRRNVVVDAFAPAITTTTTTTFPSPSSASASASASAVDKGEQKRGEGLVRVSKIPEIESRLPSRESLGVDSFPKLEILSGGMSATGIKSRESYPLHWPATSPEDSPAGISQNRVGVMASRDLWDSAQDDLQSSLVVTIQPAQPLEPHTDYLIVLRNGLSVVPVGGAEAPLNAYRSAGVVCEDNIIRFRTESMAHRKAALKLIAEEEEKEKQKAADPRRRFLERKDLSSVDWKAVKAKISRQLTSKKGARDYLLEAQQLQKAHEEELASKYSDGKLTKLIDKTMDEINPSYTEAKKELAECMLMQANELKV